MQRLAAVSLVTFFLACSDGAPPIDCPRTPCPTSRLTPHLVSGRIAFSLRGDAVQTHDLVGADPAAMSAVNACDLDLVTNFTADGARLQNPVVSCRTAQGHIDVQLAILNDPRMLTLGSHEVAPDQAGLVVMTRQVCDLVAAQGTTTIDVTRASGTAAPYPGIVTSDYARDLTVHVESSYDNGCTSESLVLDLQLTETASDYFYDGTTLCGCV